LSPDDIERMESMNPKSREEWRQEEEARRFLSGEDIATPAQSGTEHTGH
jgi:hypothetical protein